jgi:hypothetical protein
MRNLFVGALLGWLLISDTRIIRALQPKPKRETKKADIIAWPKENS